MINPYCPRCGVKMILPEDLPNYGPKLKVIPDNMCTLEHVHSRLNPLRGVPFPNTILCAKCNHEEGRKDELTAGINELHRRSLRGKIK
jgi:hypothetical protein